MPTRVVLQETAPVARPRRVNAASRPTLTPRTPTEAQIGRRSKSTPAYSFRKALRKEDDEESVQVLGALSDSDIPSSPLMSSYLYCLLCCAVMLVSIVQFFFNNDDLAVQYRDEEHYIGKYGVYRWKLRGAFAMSAAGIVIYFLIILAHFDTICFPDFWAKLFQDGSKGERNLILFLILFWIGVLYMCTSSLSVGSAQANVYFTSWIGFGVSVFQYNVWRTYAGSMTWREMLRSSPCETNYNWTVTLFFAVVAACGASDSFANRDEISIYFAGEEVRERNRAMGMILAWSSVGLCCIVIVGNYVFTNTFSMTCCKCFDMNLDWRQFEGALLVFLLALYGYFLFVYTGTLGIFNSPSNTYFGIWGTFFSAAVTLGTWIRENKHFLMFSLPASPTASSRRASSRRQTTS